MIKIPEAQLKPMKIHKMKKISTGHYTYRGWSILMTEVTKEYGFYGYRWIADHPSDGKIFGITRNHCLQEIDLLY